MKCTIPEISWHNRDPVLSVDVQPKTDKSEVYRLASGGTDSHVLIWHMTINESGSINLDVAADLTRHQRAVNAVKWSPSGDLLASGDDESVIFIWKQKAESEPVNILDATSDQDKEIWITLKILRGHMEDVYDLSWSSNSLFLVSGSVDNTAIIWDVTKGKSISILNDHKGFVQGVAWDPKNQYIASLSTDRYFRVFDVQSKRVVARTSKCVLPVPEQDNLFGKKCRLFHDDTLQTFFRRLCFSPDGNLIITPSGITDFDGATQPINTTYIYSRYNLKQPAIVLPSPDQYTVAVKCCPLLFKLRPFNAESNKPVVPLAYRMIFAIATKSSVYLYDTQQKLPFAMISNIHYTRLTDLSWSHDGRILIVSSTDGFCSLITFSDDELGEIYTDNLKENKENVTYISNTEKNSVHKAKSEFQKQTNEKVNKIAIKRKPTKPSEETVVTKTDTMPTPIQIQIKRKSLIESEAKQEDSNDTNVSEIQPQKVPILLEKLPTDIILEKSILSYDEKFESPEKKSRPATPISVRRHPRTPNSIAPREDSKQILTSPLSSLSKLATKSATKKGATPIATRKKPRALISAPIDNVEGIDKAVDAWPMGEESERSEGNESAKREDKSTEDTQCTEDIRLVYEESMDEKASETAPSVNVEKTPRRVTFKTISTPKKK